VKSEAPVSLPDGDDRISIQIWSLPTMSQLQAALSPGSVRHAEVVACGKPKESGKVPVAGGTPADVVIRLASYSVELATFDSAFLLRC